MNSEFQKLENKKLTVVVSSCDKYEEVWYPFFYLLRKYWKDCKYEVVLSTENKKYTKQEVKTINASGKWCERLNCVLDNISSPYVLLFLEDFFIQGTVDSKEVENCIDIMNDNLDIACFYFKNINCNKREEVFYERYLELNPVPDNNMYILNFMVGLWRKSVLQEVLTNMKDSSPWDIEVNGYEKCKNIISKYKFYCSNGAYGYERDMQDVFPYLSKSKAGIGITKSKWLWNTKKFLKKEGIETTLNDLRTMSYFEFCYYEDIKPFIFKAKQFIIRRIKKLKI